ncbi:MAG: hypothetical protein QOH41_1030 [Blastocatellia bacterium]|nr:hypothetical protein [Blastocatellia bacterium]
MSPGDRPVSLPNPPAILALPEWRERAVYLVGSVLTCGTRINEGDGVSTEHQEQTEA